MADLGEGPGGGPPPPRLVLDQTEARRAEKFFWRPALPPYLKIWMTTPLPPPPLSESLDPSLRQTDSTANKKTIVAPKSKMKRVRFTLNLSSP